MDIFTFPREQEITKEVVKDFIDKHQALVPKYKELKSMYEGDHDILHQKKKAGYKPDNRLVVNFAKYIVDTFNGYFIGIPVKVSHEKEEIQKIVTEFRNRNGMDDNEAELSKICSIYGHGYEYLFQNEESKTDVIYNTPLDMFIVYDDTIAQKPLFGVRYYYDKDGNLHGEMHTEAYSYALSGKNDEVILEDEKPHFYGSVPIVEYIENEERQSAFENVITLINGVNKALSEKANDVEYFSDAYIKILGADLDEETLEALRDNRIINLSGDNSEKVVVEFLAKPNADTTQENLINRLIDLIYQMAMVANINDETFGNASGVSLEFKLQPMKNLALMKERKFKASMQKRYKMIFNLPTNVPQSNRDEWMNLEYTFTRNIPRNMADEAETANKLAGITSTETALSALSIVDDPKAEMEKIKEEGTYPMYDDNNVGGS